MQSNISYEFMKEDWEFQGLIIILLSRDVHHSHHSVSCVDWLAYPPYGTGLFEKVGYYITRSIFITIQFLAQS